MLSVSIEPVMSSASATRPEPIFFNPRSMEFYKEWETSANDVVALLRAQAGRDPYDRGLTDLIGELSTRSVGPSSDDSKKKQSNFKKKYTLPFPLLADTDRQVINSFGVWGEKKFMGRVFDGIHRTTFVIDENGVVEKVIEKVDTEDHAAQIL